MLWAAFILLAIGAVVGAWCLLISLIGPAYDASIMDPTDDVEKRLACWGAVLLMLGAMAFAVAAFLNGGH